MRAAIQEANFSAAADTINLPAGTYQLTNTGSNEDAAATGDLDIGSDLTIQGAGPATTTVDGLGQDRVFDVFGGSVAINGIVIYNGNPGSAPGGGVQNSATLSLTNDTVTAGQTTGDGGGIANTKHLDLSNVGVANNYSAGNGGGIQTSGFAPDGLHATDVTVTGNTAAAGGGISASANAVLKNVTVTHNIATGTSFSGGGISSSSPNAFGGLTATDVNINANYMRTDGQGAGFANSGDATLIRVTINGNDATQFDFGGVAAGGGAYSTGSITGTDVELSDNVLGTGSDGGGLWNSGTLTLDRTTVARNTVGGDGGGIWNSGFGIELTNVTAADNQAGGSGGGMRTDADAVLLNSTFSGNTAGTAPGILATSSFPSSATSTIIAGNNGGADCAGGVGAITSNGNNLAGPSCAFGNPGDITASDPGLSPLAANGGSVRTSALLPTSPAIDAGKDSGCPALDARGVTRPQLAHCDIGAYEYSPPVASLAPPACSPTGLIDASVTAAQGGAFPTAVFTSVDGGSAQRTALTDGAAQVAVPEGLHTVEYWGESTGGDVELAHHSASVLVDQTAPAVSITSDQGTTLYTVGQPASVTISASDGGSGLASDPSAAGRPLDTSHVGPVGVGATAIDRCGNQGTASFIAQVLAPGLPLPIEGRTLNVARVSGIVLVKQPGSAAFVPLTRPSQILNGSIIDARKGRVRITIANGRGGFDTADFFEGIFKFVQPIVAPGKTAFANLFLFDGRFKGCLSAPRNPRIAAASKSKHRSVRHLWGAGKGAFRTVGRFSSATVRGTTWLTDDRCDGTLTRVTKGKVGVRDFVRNRTILLKKGKRYFAAPK